MGLYRPLSPKWQLKAPDIEPDFSNIRQKSEHTSGSSIAMRYKQFMSLETNVLNAVRILPHHDWFLATLATVLMKIQNEDTTEQERKDGLKLARGFLDSLSKSTGDMLMLLLNTSANMVLQRRDHFLQDVSRFVPHQTRLLLRAQPFTAQTLFNGMIAEATPLMDSRIQTRAMLNMVRSSNQPKPSTSVNQVFPQPRVRGRGARARGRSSFRGNR